MNQQYGSDDDGSPVNTWQMDADDDDGGDIERRYRSQKKNLAVLCFALFSMLFLSGCNRIPTEKENLVEQRESITGRTTTDVVTGAKANPPDVTITTKTDDGTTVEVKQPVQYQELTKASTNASESADAQGKASASISIPLGVKLILLAAGLVMLVLVFWLMLRSSKALRAAWALADEVMANMVGKVRVMAQASTDPKEANTLNALASSLESERATFNKD